MPDKKTEILSGSVICSGSRCWKETGQDSAWREEAEDGVPAPEARSPVPRPPWALMPMRPMFLARWLWYDAKRQSLGTQIVGPA